MNKKLLEIYKILILEEKDCKELIEDTIDYLNSIHDKKDKQSLEFKKENREYLNYQRGKLNMIERLLKKIEEE